MLDLYGFSVAFACILSSQYTILQLLFHIQKTQGQGPNSMASSLTLTEVISNKTDHLTELSANQNSFDVARLTLFGTSFTFSSLSFFNVVITSPNFFLYLWNTSLSASSAGSSLEYSVFYIWALGCL